jgi:hypothetical protein
MRSFDVRSSPSRLNYAIFLDLDKVSHPFHKEILRTRKAGHLYNPNMNLFSGQIEAEHGPQVGRYD